MILSDFLSRQKTDGSNPHDIIPISFNMRNILHASYYTIESVRRTEDKYLVQTRSQSKSSSIMLPEVHGVEKGINAHVQPEKQTLRHAIVSPEIKNQTYMKPRLGEGRVGLRRKAKVVAPSQPNKPVQVEPTPLERQEAEITKQPQADVGLTHRQNTLH